jgi:hypothetical protein
LAALAGIEGQEVIVVTEEIAVFEAAATGRTVSVAIAELRELPAARANQAALVVTE